jgi:hypothetical protein
MDREFEEQAERYVTRHFLDISKARRAARQAVENDVARRNLTRSGLHVGQLIERSGEVLEKGCDALLTELIELVERHVGLDPQSAEWLRQRYARCVEGLGRGLGQELEELTRRIGLPAVQKAAAEDVERLTGRLVSRGRLRIDTALGEADLKRRRTDAEADVSAKTDVFISHASEDKDAVARPLAEELKRRGFSVWYDEYVLKLGDSLPAEIDRGLANCRFGVVILSPRFFAKKWPRRELDGLAAREVRGGRKVILPVWHDVDAAEVEKHSPTLAAKLAVSTSEGLGAVVEQIAAVIQPHRPNPPDPVRGEPDGTPVTERGGSSAEEPVRIVGIVEEEVGRPRNDGTPGSALYPVSLRLSRTPSRVWAELFVETWNRPPQYTTQHRPGIASVEGDRIILARTTIEEIEEVHKETLRHVLARVNEEAGRLEASERKRAAAEAEAQRAHDERVQAAAKCVRFD